MSLHLRDQLGLGPIDPIDLGCLCDHFDIIVVPLRDLRDEDGRVPGLHFLGEGASTFSALTMPVGPRRVIVHNDCHGESRQRSNIAHELAHCFLGHPLTPPLLENGDRARHSGLEEEAAFLGGALLVPNEAACHVVRMGLNLDGAAREYGVSRVMLEYRIRMSGAQRIAQRSAARSWRQAG